MERRARVPRYWLHLLLLAVTLVTTTAMGARMAENFRLSRSALNLDRDMAALLSVWSDPAMLLAGLPFSLTLMVILLGHEFGHYAACRFYSIDASLPYFVPAPTLIGTFGAFIRIRSPIYSKQVLFDVGIAGPLAGFVLALPALAVGLSFSKVLPVIPPEAGDLIFDIPLLLRLLVAAIFPGAPVEQVYLHPVARAAWVGVFATALNLLPIGQLDGGHILYSFLGEKHRVVSRLLVVALVPLALFSGYWAWLAWAILLMIFGLRHPSIFDSTRLDRGRRLLGLVALAMFLLCFMAAPVTNA